MPVGNYAIPGCFATIASAVSYINTNGVSGTGTVQFDVAAGYTETAPPAGYNINATGTSTLAIKFVKAAGAASIITAGLQVASGTATASFDAIFKIVGGDYITIDGFTMQENASNTVLTVGGTNTMTEFGVLLVHGSATDGAQNNTIQNCIISLNASYTNSVGIFSTSSSSSANVALDATSTAVQTQTIKFMEILFQM
ncbi:MAG: hypothetical protein IPO83_03325 [Chitinophagaceae bacterium]|nr:hypothetical protein [Chitinophagaceae bacterium]